MDQDYPSIRFAIKNKPLIEWVAAGYVLVTGFALFFHTGAMLVLPLAALSAVAAFAIVRLLIEIVALVADTMMPR
ncbi:hypothetical protein [Hoeflea poritis]|uniref:Uncharacterized protein n=1 Tax=Hoeflea poritis TaxID=2993659 RepID=A0ABT4VWV6_9HYPH|nr:hypothetical protein [Hoeflea poritis]MDA4848527.1 hypothetical protein [Hoeflea poritis]